MKGHQYIDKEKSDYLHTQSSLLLHVVAVFTAPLLLYFAISFAVAFQTFGLKCAPSPASDAQVWRNWMRATSSSMTQMIQSLVAATILVAERGGLLDDR